MKKNKTQNKACSGAAVLAGAIPFLLVLYYVTVIAKGYYHADCTDTIMWAEAAVDAKALMNQDFAYACLLPFGGQLFMIPFVAVFGVSIKAQIIGMTLFYLIFVLALIYLCKAFSFDAKWTAALLSAALLLLSASAKLREIFWEHIIYYSLGILFLMVGLAWILRILKEDDVSDTAVSEPPSSKFLPLKEEDVSSAARLFVWTALCSMNGIQAIAIYALPAFAAVAAECFFDFKAKWNETKNLRKYMALSVLAAGILIGLLLGRIVNGNLAAGYAAAYSSFSATGEWIGNFEKLFPSFMTLLGVKVSSATLLYSIEGIGNLIRIVCSLILLAVPVIMACMYHKFETIAYRLMILVHHFMTLLILLGWIFGKLSAANWRLSPIAATSTILSVMFIKWIIEKTTYKRLSLIIAVPILCVCLTTSLEILTIEKQTAENAALNQLTDFLKENDLKYGYATFWNANIITMMSDSEVKVRVITLEKDGYKKRLYQTNKNWYETVNGYDEYFVILTDQEMEDYYNQISYHYEEAEKILKCGVYYVLVYPYNVMQR